MRDFILLYINEVRHQISDFRTLLPLSELLRDHLGLTGTKVLCSEGACGACSVLVGQPTRDEDAFLYRTTNACLTRVFQLDRCHIITVEGLKRGGTLSSAQQVVVQNHGTQCGYCTPGVVISLTAMQSRASAEAGVSAQERVRKALSGNLCRCTGYLPIHEAGLSLLGQAGDDVSESYPATPMLEDFRRNAALSARISLAGGVAGDAAYLLQSHTLSDALAYLSRFPDAVVVAGGTGVLPSTSAGASGATVATLSIGAVRELERIERRDSGLFVGATTTWAQLSRVAKSEFPELSQLLERFGSPQLRNQGTIGGSIAQAESNSDWLPLLLVQDAVVHIASWEKKERAVPFRTFLSEKCLPGELVTGVTVPLPLPEEKLRAYKVTRRQAFDRSVFCAAVNLAVASDGTIASCRIACGGLGSPPLRLLKTERSLAGAVYSEATMRDAGAVAAAEIFPVADAYADADYRRQLAERLLLRFYHDSEIRGGKEVNIA